MVPAGDWDSGRGQQGGGQMCGQQRQAKGEKDPRKEEPLGLTGAWAHVEEGKGVGNQMRDGIYILAQRTPCGRKTGDGSADEQRKPACGGAVHVDGHSAPRQVREKK